MENPTKTFKETFCEHFHVSSESFVKAAVFKCLHPNAGVLFRVLYAFQTMTATEAVRFMEKVGRTRDDSELEDVISEYHNDMADTSNFLARGLNIRVSARKVAQLHNLLRGRKADFSHDSTHYYRKDGQPRATAPAPGEKFSFNSSSRR